MNNINTDFYYMSPAAIETDMNVEGILCGSPKGNFEDITETEGIW